MRIIRAACIAAFTLCAAVVVDFSVCPSSVSAQTGRIAGLVRLDAHLGADFRAAASRDIRLDIPLSYDGAIPGVSDALALTRLDVLFDIVVGTGWRFADGRTALLLRLTRPLGFRVGLAW